ILSGACLGISGCEPLALRPPVSLPRDAAKGLQKWVRVVPEPMIYFGDETPVNRGIKALWRYSEIEMRRIQLLLYLYLSTSLFAQQPQVPEIQFQSVPDSLKLPADLYLGEAAGVAVNSKGHIFVLSRGNSTGPAYGASAAQLLEFDADGKFL